MVVRGQSKPHSIGSTLDVDGIHRRTVDALKGAGALDLCKAALAAPLNDWIGKATVLQGTAPLATRLTA